MAHQLSRVKREQLRKRLVNIQRRHHEFWVLYGIKIWLDMELPDGRLFGYHSHPHLPLPAADKMDKKRVVMRTPHDYGSTAYMRTVKPKRPAHNPGHKRNIWEELAQYLESAEAEVDIVESC
ncbi:uncharacterized protein N7483_002543 [Penicillium malachiteum]|uniref:uncharacterized protein n=1 Tax=Penicillium malachiteum TaxID=1324776 RepID=UPI002547E0B1|nr:uncharacterized protein N7483_002411 [Penicillium malachiteum]XP_056952129.1 uncharacterized protein N7483_002543 [Penicillium malachiteum]KAJ5737286.1 hypothetical protein N7483_002411 [Penicillium malachiteum]KAJ5737418.1 hypothetical protein N7483_002543 [Penicillium malachiteum]